MSSGYSPQSNIRQSAERSYKSPTSVEDDEGHDEESHHAHVDTPSSVPSRSVSNPMDHQGACDECHRLKMRCIKDKENLPCTRCRQGSRLCTYDGPRKSKSSKVEDRLRLVETQIGAMQNSLVELLHLQRGTASGPNQQKLLPTITPVSASGLQLPMSGHPVQSEQEMSDAHESAEDQSTTIRNWPESAYMPVPAPKVSLRAPSDDEEAPDPFASDHLAAPWGSMLSLAEAARLKADSHIVRDVDAHDSPGKTSAHAFDYNIERPRKRARTMSKAADGSSFELKINERGNHAFPDPVELGWCTASKGKELFDLFFEKCSPYMPCFDPDYDNWDSLRIRSPFAITAIIFVALKCQEAGGPVSDLQLKLREHAEKMGMSTLFTPVARNEIVQAMILLASWGETFWRPGGHAVRMAMDLGLYRCLPYLVQNEMGAGKSSDEIDDERSVVAGARIWLTLYKLEYEMSFAYGRPVLFSSEATIAGARQLLNHPLSVPTDIRLVSTCEILSYRMPVHQHLALSSKASGRQYPELDRLLRQCNESIKDWYDYWDHHCAQRGIPADHFLRETLVTCRAGTFLGSNSYVLFNVRNKKDFAALSQEQRRWFHEAGQMAQQLVSKCLRGQQYNKNFRFANLLTHYNIAYAARFMIRMASLIPQACDLRQIGRDVEQIAEMLTTVPGFQFAHFLRDIMLKARRDHVLPPSSRAVSRATSPTRKHVSFTPLSDFSSSQPLWFDAVASSAETGSADNISAPAQDPIADGGLDFLYADQLFTNIRSSTVSLDQNFNLGVYGNNVGASTEQGFSLDAWFPFPPLDDDSGSNGHPPLPDFKGPPSASDSTSW